MESDKLLRAENFKNQKNLINSGLEIENFDENSLRTGSFYIRIDMITVYSNIRGQILIPQDKKLEIKPYERVFCKSLERFSLSQNHYGLLLPRVWLSVKNIDIIPGAIDPGYTGKLWIIITNNNSNSIYLNSRDFVAKLLIWEKSGSEKIDLSKYGMPINREDIEQYLQKTNETKINKNKRIKLRKQGLILLALSLLTFPILYLTIKWVRLNEISNAIAIFTAYLGFLALIIGMKNKTT